MINKNLSIVYILVTFIFISACGTNNKKVESTTFEQKIISSKGAKINMMMWQGDPYINKYMNQYIIPQLKSEYGITLNLLNGQGNQIVTALLTELEAQKEYSDIDICWINGETFYQLKQIDALHGPFVDDLPNSKYINFDSKFIGIDFQQPINGFECPWGNVQLALICDTLKVPNPPINFEELRSFVKKHPGTFTIGNDFTGMTLLKSWLIGLADDPDDFNGDFKPELYQKTSTKLWEYINSMKPYFWKEGETFPASVAQMHQLYANGELWFTMSNNDAEVDNKIEQGLFASSSKAYIWQTGTIQNSHYLGITKNSANKDAAMVAINYMISPEAQFEKMKPTVWGDGTVLDLNKLPAEWKVKFENIPGRKNAPNRKVIQNKALMEPNAQYMIELFKDFRIYVIDK